MIISTASINAIEGIAYEMIDENLRAGREACLEIRTESMLPTFQPGDRIFARGTSAERLRTGDIALVKVGARLWAHRIIDMHLVAGDLRFVTKGDNSLESDPEWKASQVCGIVIQVERHGRKRNLASRTARMYGGVLALLSRSQWMIQRTPSNLFRRIALKGTSALLRISASIAS